MSNSSVMFCQYIFFLFGTVLKLFSFNLQQENIRRLLIRSQKALLSILNVSYYHATRLNIHLCLGFLRQNRKCLQWASFPRPITPLHDPELNFTPVMMAIWLDPNLGTRSTQKICVEMQLWTCRRSVFHTLYFLLATSFLRVLLLVLLLPEKCHMLVAFWQ